jgi:ABC-2 type transport system ATP-binding protein
MAADSDTAMIELRALSRSFGDLTAVDDLTFAVRRGELFGLVGPDGAGKTTTLRMLAGVLRPTAGDALVAGASVAREPEAAKQHLAYMSQRFGLYADLTVRENLDFYADLYRVPRGERRARLERLFEFSNLGPFQDRLAGKLSGGMKQKLGLSCALIHEPDVLLLDEPTFGVDPVSRRELWLIVHEMVGRGVTALVSTAYMDEAERFDRLALLHRGRMLALDDPRALQAELPGTLLRVTAKGARRARDVLRGLPGVARAALFGDRVHVTLEAAGDASSTAAAATAAAATAGDVAAALRAAGLAGVDVEPLAPSMEDVFMQRIAAAERGEAA